MLKYVLLGIFIKLITGFDDVITRMPVVSSLSLTRKGKFAFSLGTLFAVFLAIFLAVFFSEALKNLPFYRYFVSFLIVLLAFAVYFDFFVLISRNKAEKRLLRLRRFSVERFTKIFFIGFVASIITLIDDILAYTPLFLGTFLSGFYSVVGILIGTVLEIFLVFLFSDFLSKIRFKKEIASIGLFILAVLTFFGFV